MILVPTFLACKGWLGIENYICCSLFGFFLDWFRWAICFAFFIGNVTQNFLIIILRGLNRANYHLRCNLIVWLRHIAFTAKNIVPCQLILFAHVTGGGGAFTNCLVWRVYIWKRWQQEVLELLIIRISCVLGHHRPRWGSLNFYLKLLTWFWPIIIRLLHLVFLQLTLVRFFEVLHTLNLCFLGAS